MGINKICKACGTDGAEKNGFCWQCNKEGDDEFWFQHGTSKLFFISGADLEA